MHSLTKRDPLSTCSVFCRACNTGSMEAHTLGNTKGTQNWTGRKAVWVEGVESESERHSVKVYLTGHTSWVLSVCMEVLVHRGTSWRNSVVVI